MSEKPWDKYRVVRTAELIEMLKEAPPDAVVMMYLMYVGPNEESRQFPIMDVFRAEMDKEPHVLLAVDWQVITGEKKQAPDGLIRVPKHMLKEMLEEENKK